MEMLIGESKDTAQIEIRRHWPRSPAFRAWWLIRWKTSPNSSIASRRGNLRRMSEAIVINFWRQNDPCVFGHVPAWMTSQHDLEDVHRVLQATFDKIRALNDDRLSALIGGLLAEEHMEVLLSEFVGGLEKMNWYPQIQILRGLELVPARLLDAVDLIRRIRNRFAHELSIGGFADLPSDLLIELRTKFVDDVYRGPSP